MVKIAIFDSGFGSLSVIGPIQKTIKSQIIYFADQKNFPYGKKTKKHLSKIINQTISMLETKFNPDLIIIASNTPTLLLDNICSSKIFGVLPSLKEATKISKTKNIAILATQSVSKSKELSEFIKKNNIHKSIKIKKIDASPLVDLVESGKFLNDVTTCEKQIKKTLENKFVKNNIDVATLSSTHLPFLKTMLQSKFPNVTFLDPAYKIAKKVAGLPSIKKSNRNKLRIFTSGNPKIFQKQLMKLGIKNKVNFLSLS